MSATGEAARDRAGSGESAWDLLIDVHFARQAVERGLSRNSLEAYSGDLREFQNFCARSAIAPDALNAQALTAWLEELADRGFKVTSQRRRLAAVRGLIRQLVDDKILAHDPAAPLKLRPHPRAPPRTPRQ